MFKKVVAVILIFITLGLVACGKGITNFQTFSQTNSSCNQPTTTLKTITVFPFSDGKETIFNLTQQNGACKILAEVGLMPEGYSLHVTKLKVYEMSDCANETLDFEDTYTYKLESDSLILNSNACTTSYKHEIQPIP